MDARRFDMWAQSLPKPRTRRRLLGLLAGVPVLGGLSALLEDPEGAEARKKKKKKKSGKKCKPQSTATTCKGRCGTVTNNCRQAVACGPCTCEQDPSLCPDGQVCQGGVCGVACGGGFCPAATEICDANACQPCDVCPTCTHTTVQAAIDAAGNNATIRICAGSHTRPSPDGEVASVDGKNLTLVGAGPGNGGTILDDGQRVAGSEVVTIESSDCTLRNLTVTGVLGQSGIRMGPGANLTLSGVLVTGNGTLTNGGGIRCDADGVLTLEAGTHITDNAAFENGGGIDNNGGGTVIINEGARVTGNSSRLVGGGIWNQNGTIIIDGGVVDDNTADGDGNDIYNDDTVEFRRGTVGECVQSFSAEGCP